jgi:hypothetical protein
MTTFGIAEYWHRFPSSAGTMHASHVVPKEPCTITKPFENHRIEYVYKLTIARLVFLRDQT